MGAHEPNSPGLTSDEPAQSEPGGVWQEFGHIPFRPEVKNDVRFLAEGNCQFRFKLGQMIANFWDYQIIPEI